MDSINVDVDRRLENEDRTALKMLPGVATCSCKKDFQSYFFQIGNQPINFTSIHFDAFTGLVNHFVSYGKQH